MGDVLGGARFACLGHAPFQRVAPDEITTSIQSKGEASRYRVPSPDLESEAVGYTLPRHE